MSKHTGGAASAGGVAAAGENGLTDQVGINGIFQSLTNLHIRNGAVCVAPAENHEVPGAGSKDNGRAAVPVDSVPFVGGYIFGNVNVPREELRHPGGLLGNHLEHNAVKVPFRVVRVKVVLVPFHDNAVILGPADIDIGAGTHRRLLEALHTAAGLHISLGQNLGAGLADQGQQRGKGIHCPNIQRGCIDYIHSGDGIEILVLPERRIQSRPLQRKFNVLGRHWIAVPEEGVVPNLELPGGVIQNFIADRQVGHRIALHILGIKVTEHVVQDAFRGGAVVVGGVEGLEVHGHADGNHLFAAAVGFHAGLAAAGGAFAGTGRLSAAGGKG